MATINRGVGAPPGAFQTIALLARTLAVRPGAARFGHSVTAPLQIIRLQLANPTTRVTSIAMKGSVYGRSPCEDIEATSCKSPGILSVMFSLVAATMITVTSNVEPADALESLGLSAGALFQRTCAACHSGGGNLLQPGATLSKDDLERNGIVEADDIYSITYSGKARMPGYGEKCSPRGQCTFGPTLSEEDIHALAEFVKLQADQGWAK